ncbi:hypothetical protein RZS08_14655, partial [Arthrospira platensis SPKY1]|nr:hypothetical protein [Arthrospira platensis SPKY1]
PSAQETTANGCLSLYLVLFTPTLLMFFQPKLSFGLFACPLGASCYRKLKPLPTYITDMAFGCDSKDYEALRQWVIEQYGAAYELLEPPNKEKQRKRRRR